SVSWKSALVHTVAALLVPIIALRFLVRWAEIRKNLLFIYLSIASCILPMLFLSRFNYEFPSLIGGAVGLCLSVLMASYRVGLARAPGMEEASVDPSPHRDRVRAFAPYLLLIAVLIVTRVRFLPFRAWLNAESSALAVDLGSLGRLSASVALVLRLD